MKQLIKIIFLPTKNISRVCKIFHVNFFSFSLTRMPKRFVINFKFVVSFASACIILNWRIHNSVVIAFLHVIKITFYTRGFSTCRVSFPRFRRIFSLYSLVEYLCLYYGVVVTYMQNKMNKLLEYRFITFVVWKNAKKIILIAEHWSWSSEAGWRSTIHPILVEDWAIMMGKRNMIVLSTKMIWMWHHLLDVEFFGMSRSKLSNVRCIDVLKRGKWSKDPDSSEVQENLEFFNFIQYVLWFQNQKAR